MPWAPSKCSVKIAISVSTIIIIVKLNKEADLDAERITI